MPGPIFAQQRNRGILAGVMEQESNFLLDPFRFLVSPVVGAPYQIQAKILKTMPDDFLRGLGHIAVSPKRLTEPESKFAFVVALCSVLGHDRP